MIHFNELRYSNKKTSLIIDVSIDESEYFKDSYINKIVIDNQDTFIPNGPSSTPLYQYVADENSQNVRLELPVNSIKVNPKLDMVFVYILTTPGPNVPCELAKEITIGTVIDLQCVYDNLIRYIKQISNDCSTPKEFIDMFLKYKALDLCVRTGNYPLAIKYWNKYFKLSPCNNTVIKPCDCHGRY